MEEGKEEDEEEDEKEVEEEEEEKETAFQQSTTFVSRCPWPVLYRSFQTVHLVCGRDEN